MVTMFKNCCKCVVHKFDECFTIKTIVTYPWKLTVQVAPHLKQRCEKLLTPL